MQTFSAIPDGTVTVSIAALWMVGMAVAGQTATPITQVGSTAALSTVSQRHMVRVAPADGAAVLLLAVQRDAASSPDPQGLHWYRSDDEGRTFHYYAPILQDASSSSELHMAADAVVEGEDVLIVVSYDTTSTTLPSDSRDPQRTVSFQRWRYSGHGGWSPDPWVRIAAPPSGHAYHRATLALDSVGRVWVTAWLRSPCPASAGVNCTDELQVWTSLDGGAAFSQASTLTRLPLRGGGRLISLGDRLMMLWGDYSWSNPARYMLRRDGDPIESWSAPVNAFPDRDSIYHGAALNAVADGAGGLHVVYKDRYNNLYYRYFDGTSFGARTWVDGSSPSDWALQPAITLHGRELYVCANHPVDPTRLHELRSYKLSDGFASHVVLDSSATFKAYPTAPEFLPPDATSVPCAYGRGGSPVTLMVAGRVLTGDAPGGPEPPGDAPGGAEPPGAFGFGFGSTWRYDDRNVDPGAAWISAGFDDSAWGSGPGQLGYGDGDENTVLRRTSPAQPSVYFRKRFDLDTVPPGARMTAIYDDAIAVWINDNLVLSRNVNAGLGHGTYASAASGENERITADIPGTHFRPGENVVAALVKQAGGSSSDVSFDLALEPLAAGPPVPQTGIPFGSVWRYDDRGIDPGASWITAGFDDSAWPSGPGQLGYGDGDERTALRRTSPAQTSVYFRHKITLGAAPSAATLQVLYDDAFAVWVNGTLVLTMNTGAGLQHGAYASAGSSDNARITAEISASAFQAGENTLAVMVKQVDGSSSDVSFDLELVLTGASP